MICVVQKGLEVTVVLEVGVSILYGLEVCVEAKMKIFKEIDMNNDGKASLANDVVIRDSRKFF